MRRVLIVGGSSGIGAELARELVRAGSRVVVLGRNLSRLEQLVSGLNSGQGEPATFFIHDVNDTEKAPRIFEDAISFLGGLDVLIYSAGVLIKAPAIVTPQDEEAMLRVNLLGAIRWMNLAATLMQEQGRGVLVGIGSVAGDRGRAVSPGYCASKAGLHAYLEGLRGQMHGSGVDVVVVKPGPVDTPMTEGVEAPMMIDVSRAAKDIVAGIRRADPVVYVPRRWRAIMAAVGVIPPSIFKRLKF